MALHTELSIHKVAYDLLDVITDLVRNMPRDFKQSLGAKLRDEAIEILTEERHVPTHFILDNRLADATPHITQQLAELVGVPFESVTHPRATPSKAAPAAGEGQAAPAEAKGKKTAAKKPKGKADPAPAAPANEAATPPKAAAPKEGAALSKVPAWPFPTGAKV